MSYTPSRQSVRQHYLELSETVSGSQEIAQGNVESFDRWLAEELHQAKADGFDEGVRASGLDLDYILQLLDNNPYRSQP